MRVLPHDILKEYGFLHVELSSSEADHFWRLLRALVHGTGNYFQKDHGLYILNNISIEFLKNTQEYQNYCSEPDTRTLLLRLYYLCNKECDALKTEILKNLPVDISCKWKQYFDSIVSTVKTHIATLQRYCKETEEAYPWHPLPRLNFEARWDYLVRAVPYFEEFIKDLRDFLSESKRKKEKAHALDSDVLNLLKKHRFHKVFSGVMGTLAEFPTIVENLLGDNEEWPKCGLCKLVERLSYTFYERAMKSLTRPSCLYERLMWFTCLWKDSHQQLAYYNIRQSALITTLTRELKEARLDSYVNEVINALLILPIMTSEVIKQLTRDNIDYGYYAQAIFSSKYSEEYMVLFFKVLIDLLRDVYHILMLTAPGNYWYRLPLEPPDFIKSLLHVNDRVTQKTALGTIYKTNEKKQIMFEWDAASNSPDYALQLQGTDWSIVDPKSVTPGSKDRDVGRSQMWDWFIYQGFSQETLKTTITGIVVHKLMYELFQGVLGLQNLYANVRVVIRKTLEKFLTPPKTFKAQLDWLAKLDVGDISDYNALDELVNKVRGMATEDSENAAETLNSLVGYAGALRRLLLEDPDDFGVYKHTFCFYTAVDSYLFVLYDFIDQLETDMKEMHTKTMTVKGAPKILKEHNTLRSWLDNQGFKDSKLHLDTKVTELKSVVELCNIDTFKLLRKQLQYAISIIEPDNVQDMVAWCTQIKKEKYNFIGDLKRDLKNTVFKFVGSTQALEMKEVVDNFVTALPKISECITKTFRSRSPFANATFHKELYDYYRRIFFKILSAVYQHWLNRHSYNSSVDICEVETMAEANADYHILQKPITKLEILRKMADTDVDKVIQINAELNTIFESVFGITNGNENRKNALEGYVAMMQGKSLIRQPDESNIALTAAVTTAVGTGAVGAGVVYFKFNALYAFFGKLLA
ncbi:bifunctional (p)ppGpp synthetase/guanosine-3',5'-bis(diphosphate) 3'-pyrophosphohydrolase [Babesia caballi]|uniref:Bifunctional (P)ppGpp synthetase/guanosine-3',5'-bis(Diphosphate) 3'-pyrophosphohydrolase n=1 Tax=Babesia caballi TaxID=5871 RepID=A0AAV4LPJ6_BABCB|nr:bifunctional (p)ppGpp synthetase/guanosine-3',5'-bis(diphosphate) 3'-pyrophosphohydrolase [Babesia caballi]